MTTSLTITKQQAKVFEKLENLTVQKLFLSKINNSGYLPWRGLTWGGRLLIMCFCYEFCYPFRGQFLLLIIEWVFRKMKIEAVWETNKATNFNYLYPALKEKCNNWESANKKSYKKKKSFKPHRTSVITGLKTSFRQTVIINFIFERLLLERYNCGVLFRSWP